MAKTVEDHKRFIELRAKGFSYAKIANEMNINKNSCIKLSRQYEIEIRNTKQIELEAIREEYFLMKKQKLMILSKQLEKVRNQLEIRDFSDVDTKDLIHLQSDLIKEIEIEFNRGGVSFREKKGVIDMDFEDIVETWQT